MLHDPWQIDEADFPANGSAGEQLRFVVGYAVLAPSGHNTQPWLFRVHDDGLDVIADRRRALPVVDPDDRELTISCGAALEFACTALRYFGREPEVELMPERWAHDVLARVRIAGDTVPDDDTRDRFHAIPVRRTVRAAYDESPIESMILERMELSVREHDAVVRLVTDRAQRHAIAGLVAEGDRLQFADKRFRRELAMWIHSRHGLSHDGVSGSGFGMPDLLSPVGALAVRTVDMGERVATHDAEIAESSPVLGCLNTAGDSVTDWLHAGRALAALLLTATASGIRASYLNQPAELPELRPRLADVVGLRGTPQLLMRFGYGPMVDPAVRRPVADVMLPE